MMSCKQRSRRRRRGEIARRRSEHNARRRQAARERSTEADNQLILTVVALDLDDCPDREVALARLRLAAVEWGADYFDYDGEAVNISTISLWRTAEGLSAAEVAAYATADYFDSLGTAPVLYVGAGRAGAVVPEVALGSRESSGQQTA
jgi:hypothetical protein